MNLFGKSKLHYEKSVAHGTKQLTGTKLDFLSILQNICPGTFGGAGYYVLGVNQLLIPKQFTFSCFS